MSIGTILLIILILLLVGAIQTWLWIGLIRSSSIAALAHHVHRIVMMRAEKKMCRIAAHWIITMMADKKSVWNLAMRCFPCDAMCRLTHAPVVQMPITLSVQAGKPTPTFVRSGLFDALPQLFLDTLFFASQKNGRAMRRTCFALSECSQIFEAPLKTFALKRRIADWTNLFWVWFGVGSSSAIESSCH